MSDPANPERPPGAAAKPCAICGRPAHPDFLPFCSKRCRSVDLNRWLGGAYAIPGDPTPGEGEDQG